MTRLDGDWPARGLAGGRRIEVMDDAMADNFAGFLRQLLQEANIVQECVALAPIVHQLGAIEEDRIEEAIFKFTRLLGNAIQDARAKNSADKRVHIFLRVDKGGGNNG